MRPFIYPTVIIAFITLVLIAILLRYTKFGRKIYAIGGSEQSSLLMGLTCGAHVCMRMSWMDSLPLSAAFSSV